MARHISPSNATNRTIDAIDRKREKERHFLLVKARDNAPELAIRLVQRLIDEHIIETNSDKAIRESMEKQLKSMIDIEEFDMQFKIAPIRSLSQDPNIISLFITSTLSKILLIIRIFRIFSVMILMCTRLSIPCCQRFGQADR